MYSLDSIQIAHEREIYSSLDFISDIGGVFDLFLLILNAFFLRVSDFSYRLDVISKLYKISKQDSHTNKMGLCMERMDLSWTQKLCLFIK